jgi:alpha-D-ribose 1-methylphosphonate 5-phosphate C-P lyase
MKGISKMNITCPICGSPMKYDDSFTTENGIEVEMYLCSNTFCNHTQMKYLNTLNYMSKEQNEASHKLFDERN